MKILSPMLIPHVREWAYSTMPMVENMKEIGLKIKDTDKDRCFIPTAMSIKAAG